MCVSVLVFLFDLRYTFLIQRGVEIDMFDYIYASLDRLLDDLNHVTDNPIFRLLMIVLAARYLLKLAHEKYKNKTDTD